jgi:hypothetical protein
MAKTHEEHQETRHVRELRRQIIKLRRELAQERKRSSRAERANEEMLDELA